MKILISNDDGYRSEGIQALFRELKNGGHDVIMLAPDRERSTVSHALTLHKPLRMTRIAEDQYMINGTPADCIFVGLRHQWRFTPEMVITGINRGANLGTDVHYSGTVSGAREAAFSGVPAIATSLVLSHDNTPEEREIFQNHQHYDTPAKLTVALLSRLAEMRKFPHRLLNLNCPNVKYEDLKGVRLAFLGDRKYSGELDYRVDPRGHEYLWTGGVYAGYTPLEGSDNNFIAKGFATLTPVNLDPTDHSLLQEMKLWGIEEFST